MSQTKNKKLTAMKTSVKTSDAKIQKRLFMIFVLVIITFVVGVKSTFGQRKQIEYVVTTEEPAEFCSFRYDGFSNPLDAPAFVSIETLENDEIDRKMEEYNPQGLPSMEEVKKTSIIMILLENVLLGHLIKEEGDERVAHLIKEEGDNETAEAPHLIKDDTLAHLVNPDWDGAHSA